MQNHIYPDIDSLLHETNSAITNECHNVNIEDGHLHYFIVDKIFRAVKKIGKVTDMMD